MLRWCIDRKLALTLYAGFAACGGGDELKPCNPAPQDILGIPTIRSIEPTSGPPGTTVTITGTGFDQIDARFEVAYGDFALTCDHGTMNGQVLSDTQIEVIVPEQANLPGYIYLLMDGLTVSRSPLRFELDRPAVVTVTNYAQFPVVTAESAWEPLLEAGDRIDVDESRALEVPAGRSRIELCVGGKEDGEGLQPWACVAHDTQLDPGETQQIVVEPFGAARFLAGDWVATWTVGEDEVEEERLTIANDGYWELRYQQQVVEHGEIVDYPWQPYARDFEFSLRDDDLPSSTTVPVRNFRLFSTRAGDRLDFYRAE